MLLFQARSHSSYQLRLRLRRLLLLRLRLRLMLGDLLYGRNRNLPTLKEEICCTTSIGKTVCKHLCFENFEQAIATCLPITEKFSLLLSTYQRLLSIESKVFFFTKKFFYFLFLTLFRRVQYTYSKSTLYLRESLYLLKLHTVRCLTLLIKKVNKNTWCA
jgi:hypothetical protein